MDFMAFFHHEVHEETQNLFNFILLRELRDLRG